MIIQFPDEAQEEARPSENPATDEVPSTSSLPRRNKRRRDDCQQPTPTSNPPTGLYRFLTKQPTNLVRRVSLDRATVGMNEAEIRTDQDICDGSTQNNLENEAN